MFFGNDSRYVQITERNLSGKTVVLFRKTRRLFAVKFGWSFFGTQLSRSTLLSSINVCDFSTSTLSLSEMPGLLDGLKATVSLTDKTVWILVRLSPPFLSSSPFLLVTIETTRSRSSRAF